MLKAIIIQMEKLAMEGYIDIPYIIDLMKDLQNNEIKYSRKADPDPTPEIFLTTAEQLGALPEECLVIVDSYKGVTSANAAGMACIGYVNHKSDHQDLSNAAMLVEGFDEVDYAFVNSVYQHAHMEPLTILTTDHFIIRELSVNDIDELYQICQDSSIKKYLDDFEDNLDIEKEKHQAYIKNIYHFYGYGLWGVFFKENNRLAGRCGIEYKQLDGENIYELGYLLGKSYQGNGYAKEFVTEVLTYCFTELDIHRIIAVIDKTNVRSIHLAEQVGLIKIGNCIRHNHDCYTYEITYHQ